MAATYDLPGMNCARSNKPITPLIRSAVKLGPLPLATVDRPDSTVVATLHRPILGSDLASFERGTLAMACTCTTVVFDLDGTLTDSLPGIVASFRHTLAGLGIEADERSIEPWIGPPLREGFEALGVPRDRIEVAVDGYRTHFSAVGIYDNRLFDGVPSMLSELRSAGLTLALATSKLQVFADRILDHFDISDNFSVIAGASEIDGRIEKEDIVAFALESLGRPDPSAVVLVGDREHDIRAARHHGLRAVGAAWGYGSREELREAGSEILIEEPLELVGLLLPRAEECATVNSAMPLDP